MLSSPTYQSLDSVDSILKEVRLVNGMTATATLWDCPEVMDKALEKGRVEEDIKSIGIGALPGFVGGSGFSFDSRLASYSVYHRYRWYLRQQLQILHRKDQESWSSYDENFYKANQCLGGCPTNAQCEWGICECKEGFQRAWGGCHNLNSSLPEPPMPQTQTDSCQTSQDCFQRDMNLVCRDDGEEKTCQCREDMRWNNKAFECQIFLDVDCSHLNYSTPVSDQVLAAAEKVKQRRRGWVNEAEKKRKILALPDLRLATKLHGRIAIARAYDEGNICGKVPAQQTRGCSMYSFERKLRPERRVIASNRSETPTESLADSLLPVLSNSSSRLEADVWREAFCRDVEAFSHVLLLDQNVRPQGCPKINSSLCAVLYDSATCSSGGWKLSVESGIQKQLNYWTSDWKYRNDADIVGVRSGCTFTGWTGTSFDGEKFSLTAGMSDRWIVFAKSQVYAAFDENILSFQCNCRS